MGVTTLSLSFKKPEMETSANNEISCNKMLTKLKISVVESKANDFSHETPHLRVLYLNIKHEKIDETVAPKLDHSLG